MTRICSPFRNMSSLSTATWSRTAMYRSPSSLAPESVRAWPRTGGPLCSVPARPIARVSRNHEIGRRVGRARARRSGMWAGGREYEREVGSMNVKS